MIDKQLLNLLRPADALRLRNELAEIYRDRHEELRLGWRDDYELPELGAIDDLRVLAQAMVELEPFLPPREEE